MALKVFGLSVCLLELVTVPVVLVCHLVKVLA
jgi:hypothetical protein